MKEIKEDEIFCEGAKLSRKQLEIYDQIRTSPKKWHILNASRQSGKSFLLLQLLLNYALNYKNNSILVVSPNHAGNLNLMDKIIKMTPKGLISKHNRFEKWMIFATGSRVNFKSGDVWDSIRGGTYRICLLDEFSYMRQDDVLTAVRPTTATYSDSKIIIASTPRGKNKFWELFQMGSSNIQYQNYQMMYWDNEFYDLEEVESARKELPDRIFRTEYGAEFLDSGFVFSNINECAVLDPNQITGTTFFGGIDVGKTHDATVLTILNENFQVVNTLRIISKSYDYIIKFIAQNLLKYKVRKCYIETNFETLLYESIKKEPGIQNIIMPFITTHTSKNRIIEQLILKFEKKEIQILKKDRDTSTPAQVIRELELFDCKYSKASGALIYQAAANGFDDCVISLALAVDMANNYQNNLSGNLHVSKIEPFRKKSYDETGR